MRFLLDTCVVSEVRRDSPSPQAVEFLRSTSESDLFISVLTIGEIRRGVNTLSASKRRIALEDWLQKLKVQFAERTVPVDGEIAELWGELSACARQRGDTLPSIDGLIAATAIRHGLTVATRNARHFLDSGAQVLNPWVD